MYDKSSGQKIQLHIWDTAGQERFKSITKHYYRGADACLLVFDISSPESFEELPNWYAEIRDNTAKDCIVCLVGNKCDLESSGMRSISKEDAGRFAEKHKMIYQETSALWPRESNSKKDRKFSIQNCTSNLLPNCRQLQFRCRFHCRFICNFSRCQPTLS